jgi:hypothetical protein
LWSFGNDQPVIPLVGPSRKLTAAFRGRCWIRVKGRGRQAAEQFAERMREAVGEILDGVFD